MRVPGQSFAQAVSVMGIDACVLGSYLRRMSSLSGQPPTGGQRISQLKPHDELGMKILTKRQILGLGGSFTGGLLLLASFSVNAQEIEPVLETSRQVAQATSQSQERIDEIDSRTQDLINRYRASLKQLEQLNRYNESQQRQVQAQRNEIESLTNDIDNIASLQRAVQPLMEDMVDALGRMVEADLPFLLDERRDRVDRLEGVMNDASRSAAERYRLIVEAYQIENEYGRTIEAYRGDIEIDGRQYENVEFLRIGRVLLVVRTDDWKVMKRYDQSSGEWVDLDGSYQPYIRDAIRVAREQIPPELMTIPVTAPQAAE